MPTELEEKNAYKILIIFDGLRYKPTSQPTSREFQRLVAVSSRAKLRTFQFCLGLGDIRLGSRLGLGSKGLVHIPNDMCIE